MSLQLCHKFSERLNVGSVLRIGWKIILGLFGAVSPAAAQSSDPYSDIPQAATDVVLEEIIVFPNTSGKEDPPKPGRRAQIVSVKPLDGTELLFANDTHGPLYRLEDGELSKYMDVSQEIGASFYYNDWAVGFTNFVFHPDFLSNGRFYTVHTERSGSGVADYRGPQSKDTVRAQSVVVEWTVNDPSASVFSGGHRELLRIDLPSTGHPLSFLAFNPHSQARDLDYGMLYISGGDGASVRNGYDFNSGRLDSPLGCLMRIDPMGTNGPNGRYGIPSDNPFVNSGEPGVIKEIWAYGFRNCSQFGWDIGKSEKMLLADIGRGNIEEINVGIAGGHYGWPMREGQFLMKFEDEDHIYPLPGDDQDFGFTYSVAEYDHSEGFAIAGGYVYRGSEIPELDGMYIFGDIKNGRIFCWDFDAWLAGRKPPIQSLGLIVNGEETTLTELVDNYYRTDLRLSQDAEGEMYISMKRDGVLRKITETSLGRSFKTIRGLEMRESGDGWESWIGPIEFPADDWAFSPEFGWVYAGNSMQNHIWSNAYGWWFATPGHFPFVYSYEKGSWLYYLPGTAVADEAKGWFFNYSINEWETL